MTDDARPWIEAWQNALYSPDGFYRSSEGPAGHFATSAQGIPGVSDVLAQTIVAFAEQCDAEVVVDLACGRGELAESLLPFVGKGVDVLAVDVVDRPETLAPRVHWARSPGGAAIGGLDAVASRRAFVIAHEWLDVVPCTIAQADDDAVLRVVHVTREGEESLGDVLAGADLDWCHAHAATATKPLPTPPLPGTRIEVGRARDEAWSALVAEVARVAEPGSVVVGVDYGYRSADRPPSGTLTGFRDGTECSPIPDATCDLTAHVALDSLDADTCRTQREVMLELFGSEPLAPVPLDLAHSEPAQYLQRLAVRSAMATAVHPDGLGAFHWFTRTV